MLGHLHEMTAGSGVGARLAFSRVPILDGVMDLVRQGVVPGGTKRNFAYAEPFTSFDAALDEAQRLIMADAQTSGGLLLAVPAHQAATLVCALEDQGVPVVAEIGEITGDQSGRIIVEQ